MKNAPFIFTFSLGCAAGALITKLSLGALQTGEAPEVMTSNFVELQGLLTRGVPLVYLALLAIQVWAYLRRGASGWLFALGWIYVAVFTAIDYVWLSDVVFHHTKATGTWEGGFNAMGIVGMALIPVFGLASVASYVVARSRRVRSEQAPTQPVKD